MSVTQWVVACLLVEWFYMKIIFKENISFVAKTVMQIVVLKAIELAKV